MQCQSVYYQSVLPECVFLLAEAGPLTGEAKRPAGTHGLPALGPPEPGLTQTAAVDVVAPCAVGARTHTFTVEAVRACSTLLTAPATHTIQQG